MERSFLDKLYNKYYNLEDNIDDLSNVEIKKDIFYDNKQELVITSSQINSKRLDIVSKQYDLDNYFELEGDEILELVYMLHSINQVYENEYKSYDNYVKNYIYKDLSIIYNKINYLLEFIVKFQRTLKLDRKHNYNMFYDFRDLINDFISYEITLTKINKDKYDELINYKNKLKFGLFYWITQEYINSVSEIYDILLFFKNEINNTVNDKLLTSYNKEISTLLESLTTLRLKLIFINNYRNKIIQEDTFIESEEFNSKLMVLYDNDNIISTETTNIYENEKFSSSSEEINDIYKLIVDLINYIYNNMTLIIDINEIISDDLIDKFNNSINYYFTYIIRELESLNLLYSKTHISFKNLTKYISIVKDFYKNEDVNTAINESDG